MPNQYLQISANITTPSAWTKLRDMRTGLEYRVPSSGTAIAKSIRILNLDSGNASVSLGISPTATPSDDRLILAPADINASESVMLEGVVVLASGWYFLAKVENPYPSINVTVTVALLQIT